MDDIALISAQVKQLPQEKELAAKLGVMTTRGKTTAAALERTVAMLKSLELDTTRYGTKIRCPTLHRA